MRSIVLAFALVVSLAPASAGAQGARLRFGGDTATWIGSSGQLRVRGESWRGFGAGAPATANLDDAFAMSRLLLRGEIHVAGHAAVVAEAKSSLAVSRDLPGGNRTADEDVLDLQQLYAELGTTAGPRRVAVRGGRFDLALGRERLVSPLDWSNTRRVFQGFQARATARGTEVTAFWVRPVSIRRRLPNVADTMKQLYGAQLAWQRPGLVAEAYWLRLQSASASFNGTAGVERRHTLGTRLARLPASGRLDAELEAAWQTGSLGSGRVRAWTAAAEAGYSVHARWTPRVYAGVDAASGDAATGGDVGTFNQLFPLGHAYFGYADFHGRANVVDLRGGATVAPARGVALVIDVHDFRRASTGDALYAMDGSVARPAGTGLPARVGSEVDLTLRRTVRRVTLQAGASRYFAGPFLRATGAARDISWVYAQATTTF